MTSALCTFSCVLTNHCVLVSLLDSLSSHVFASLLTLLQYQFVLSVRPSLCISVGPISCKKVQCTQYRGSIKYSLTEVKSQDHPLNLQMLSVTANQGQLSVSVHACLSLFGKVTTNLYQGRLEEREVENTRR